MLSTLFGNSNIPLLEQVVNFTEARHSVLAGNIANLDTPGYTTRDLSPELFQERLRAAVQATRGAGVAADDLGAGSDLSAAERGATRIMGRDPQAFDQVRDSYKSILRHDGVNVSMENQINQIVKNQQEHNMAAGILANQFHLLRAAISERVA